MKELIKNYFKGYSKRGIINTLPKFLRNNPEVKSYLNNILIENPNWENIRNIIYGICFDEQLKKCKNCGKEMKYSQMKLSYCSKKCKSNSVEVKDKIKQTNLEKYGCKCSLQNKEIQDKIKQTCIERYGCENPFQNENIKNKIKQTNLERLGYEHPSQNKEIKNRIKQTNLEKYGYKCSLQNKEIQDKIKQTCLEKYNCEHPSQNKEIRKKIKQTNLERLGCENPLQNKKVKEKVKQTHYNNSYNNFILSFIQYGVAPLFPKEEYAGWNKAYRWKCNKCGNEFEQKIHTTSHIKECPYLPRCWNCYPRLSGESKVEIELFDFVKQYYPNTHKDNKLINPKELDIVIDELKLAIEFNGDYWHSIEFSLEKYGNLDEYYGYHLNKVLETNKQGYRLIHIWENEYNKNPESIKKKLMDILQNKENLNFTESTIKLDRSWYNNIEIPGYKLVEELPPEMINRNGFNVENCGYLIYERIN